ncbi:MAG: hypothetical protein ACI9H8_002417 [Lysobacterales bacterium]
MSRNLNRQAQGSKFGIAAGALLCIFSLPAFAQNSVISSSDLIDEDSAFSPVSVNQNNSVLAFDMAGSETRKLQLQLSEPLSLNVTTQSRWLNLSSGSLLAGTSLEWMASDNLGINTRASQSVSQIQFQPVGSIHCQNGVLEAGSYRASGCYFTNDPDALTMGVVSIGADYDFGNNAMAAINLFRQEAKAETNVLQSGPLSSPGLDAGLRGPVMSNPLLPGFENGSGLESLDTSVSGIDLAFNVGVSTDYAGDMQVGLQFTHMLDASYDGLSAARDGYTNWTIAEPFDSARVSFDWQKNSFSGGVQGFYRDPVEFMNRETLDSVTTFDVYFTWRAPWNASLSVGASNLLNSGVDEPAIGENTINDPFEAVYGRIPYVRYQQDL